MHCQPIDLALGLPIWLGLDFGLTPAAVLGQRKANGAWLARDELVATDMGVARFAEQLGTWLRGEYSGYRVEQITGVRTVGEAVLYLRDMYGELAEPVLDHELGDLARRAYELGANVIKEYH